MAQGTFARAQNDFSDFLWTRTRTGNSTDWLENGGVVARNFLLDEGVPAARRQNYSASVVTPTDFKSWKDQHNAYLLQHVFPISPDDGYSGDYDADDPDFCAETFRHPARSPYAHSHPTLDLLRLVEVSFPHSILKHPIAQLTELAQAARMQPEHSADAQRFERMLRKWHEGIQLRPVYACYWEDMQDLFGATPDQDQAGWADQMRDRLGLAHLDPGQRGEIDVWVFRYRVDELPKLRQWSDQAALVPPTVLDGDFSTAFCPAPSNCATGHVVHLDGNDQCVRREVLHLPLCFRSRHLWRVGRITTPVNTDNLPIARAIHLNALRTLSARPDYAELTDADLLS